MLPLPSDTSSPDIRFNNGNEEELRKKYDETMTPPRNEMHKKKVTTPSEPSPTGKEEPILILDIKLVKDRPEKIIVYEKDVPEDVVRRFCEEHSKLLIFDTAIVVLTLFRCRTGRWQALAIARSDKVTNLGILPGAGGADRFAVEE